jgi:O-antigen/teichoic acid export membrane protein
MDLKSKVKKGLIWTFLDQVITQVVFLVFGIYLSRILSPNDFGLVAMITIFSSFAALFIDLGFGVALVQKKEATQEHYSSVFWFNLAIGTTLYLLFFFLAPVISLFYGKPELTLLVRVVCLSFIITSLTSVQSNLLIKELKFKKKSIFNWVALFSGYITAIVMALNGYGVWAIVFMTLITASINSILFWLTSSWRPSFIFHWTKIKELSKFGLNVLGDTTINYWSRNLDNFIIAKYLGSSELGLYTRAYSLMLLPLKNISTVISRVMFPAFSKKQGEIETIKKHYLQIIKHIAFLTFPLMVILALVSKEFVLIFFGEKWKGMIPILSILSGIGALQSLLSLNGMLYNSLAKANIALRVTILVNITLIIAFFIGIQYGLIGITWSYFIASVILFIPIYKTAISLINTTLKEVFDLLKGILMATFVAASVIVLINHTVEMSLLLSLIVKVTLSTTLYVVLLCIFEKSFMMNLLNKVLKLMNRKQ